MQRVRGEEIRSGAYNYLPSSLFFKLRTLQRALVTFLLVAKHQNWPLPNHLLHDICVKIVHLWMGPLTQEETEKRIWKK